MKAYDFWDDQYLNNDEEVSFNKKQVIFSNNLLSFIDCWIIS